MQRRPIPLLLAALAISACTGQPAPSDRLADAPASGPPAEMAVPAGQAAMDVQNLPVPDGDTVRYFVRNAEDGQARTLTDFWFGFPFELEGKHYYTGFAWDLSDEGPAGAGLGLSQATFVANPGDTRDPWKLLSAWRVGTVPDVLAPSELDGTRELKSFQTPSGDLLLAVPTVYSRGERRLRDFDLILFDPHLAHARNRQAWRYVGSLHAGQEGNPDCPARRAHPDCDDITGQLSFAMERGQDLPLLQVALTGPAATSKTTQFRYDGQAGQYQRATP